MENKMSNINGIQRIFRYTYFLVLKFLLFLKVQGENLGAKIRDLSSQKYLSVFELNLSICDATLVYIKGRRAVLIFG